MSECFEIITIVEVRTITFHDSAFVLAHHIADQALGADTFIVTEKFGVFKFDRPSLSFILFLLGEKYGKAQ
jgi:hypothetical protein